ncbi:MAG: LytTR family DNA-binding domain-containing protein [Anaerovorax sp.]
MIANKLVNEYIITKEHLDCEVSVFLHPDELLSRCEKEVFDIYVLDIVMPMISGLELGKNIRQHQQSAQIIYTTTEPSFALDAYCVNPLHYLLKPIEKELLFGTLDLAFSKVNCPPESTVTIKTREGIVTLFLGNILCCEYCHRSAKYILVNGEILQTTTLHGSFSEHIFPLLKDKRMLLPHNSYVVNMNYVEKLTREGIRLRGGIVAPISIKQFATVRDTYLDFMFDRENR